MSDEDKKEKIEAVFKLMSDQEKAELLKKVEKKLKGKTTKMSEKEADEFYDTRRF